MFLTNLVNDNFVSQFLDPTVKVKIARLLDREDVLNAVSFFEFPHKLEEGLEILRIQIIRNFVYQDRSLEQVQ